MIRYDMIYEPINERTNQLTNQSKDVIHHCNMTAVTQRQVIMTETWRSVHVHCMRQCHSDTLQSAETDVLTLLQSISAFAVAANGDINNNGDEFETGRRDVTFHGGLCDDLQPSLVLCLMTLRPPKLFILSPLA